MAKMCGNILLVQMTQLASNLRAERARKGWSQAELAERAGTTKTTVSSIEGGNGCRTDTLTDLARALEIPVATLLADSTGAQQETDRPSSLRDDQPTSAPRGASSEPKSTVAAVARDAAA